MVREINPLDMVAAIETEPSFVVAFRGYRRRDVDHYAAVAEAQIAELVAERHDLQNRLVGLTEQLHQVQTEIVELRRRPAVDGTVSFRHLGHRAERILTEAEDQAEAIRLEATGAAREELLQLNRDLVQARERNAREEGENAVRLADAESALSRARDEARRLLTAAGEEAGRILQSARLEADQLVGNARGRGQRAVVDSGWSARDQKPDRSEAPGAIARAGSSTSQKPGDTSSGRVPEKASSKPADKASGKASDKASGKPADKASDKASGQPSEQDSDRAPAKNEAAEPKGKTELAKDATHLPRGAQADEAVRRAHRRDDAPHGKPDASKPSGTRPGDSRPSGTRPGDAKTPESARASEPATTSQAPESANRPSEPNGKKREPR